MWQIYLVIVGREICVQIEDEGEAARLISELTSNVRGEVAFMQESESEQESITGKSENESVTDIEGTFYTI